MRLSPDTDLRRALESAVDARFCHAAFVTSGIGGLRQARLRLAGKDEPEALEGDFEILRLAGTISRDGAHLHMGLADANGRVIGGHVAYDCIVRATAEVLLLLLPEWSFTRNGPSHLLCRTRRPPRAMRFVTSAMPTGGHVNPMLPVAATLRRTAPRHVQPRCGNPPVSERPRH